MAVFEVVNELALKVTARPGDVIYYGGHVGIYIGNGQIVHASTERTGIKITSATYRSIITVRRIV